ncbi:MAG: HD domain-containing protein, partial [Syntrophomonas sp.]|nr:HD domain-containing protein [Syntrophomonas sp.]
FNGKTQVNVKRLKVLNEDPSTYMKTPLISRSELEKKFEEYLQSIEDSHMSAVLERIFSAEIRPVFFNAAAAKSIHHNYSGGLLEHTLEVADLCMRACPVFPSLNRDMLLTGALLHDIGKIEELEMKVVPQYSVEGRLLGHVVMGTELLTQEINDMRREGLEFPSKLEWMLKHMLLSHHGTLEFGSPVIPLFPEAFLLHMMDNLDAKMFVFFNKIEESGGENELFTNYDNFFGQHFFKYRYNEKKA